MTYWLASCQHGWALCPIRILIFSTSLKDRADYNNYLFWSIHTSIRRDEEMSVQGLLLGNGTHDIDSESPCKCDWVLCPTRIAICSTALVIKASLWNINFVSTYFHKKGGRHVSARKGVYWMCIPGKWRSWHWC
jgi:hypothetical protein